MPFTLDLFQRLEEVEAHQRVAPFNLQLALDGFNVLEVFFQDTRNFCINHTDHNVSSHVRAAFQLLGSLGRVDNGANADNRALVRTRLAPPYPLIVLKNILQSSQSNQTHLDRLVFRVALHHALFALDL